MTLFWSLAADTLLAVLLVGTIITAIRLDKALRVIRRDRDVFEALIANLSSATESVKIGIQALRDEAERAARHIGQRSQEADKMATDLSFLIDAADGAGGRLEERLRSIRPMVVVPIHESKSVRIGRILRTSRLIPKRRQNEAPVKEPMPAPNSGSRAMSLSHIALAQVPPVAAGKDSRPIGLLGLAGITIRRRTKAVVTAVPGVTVDTDVPEASQDLASAKGIG